MKRQALLGALSVVAVSLLFARPPVADATLPPPPERPVVVIPGIMGSKLCRIEEDGNRTVIWGTLDSILRFSDLRLDDRAEPTGSCGLIREMSYLGLYTQEIYRPILERLKAAGYREGSTLLTFDYDWRQSVFDNAARFKMFLERSVPKDAKVDIVAHSMGGLVARAFILQEDGARRVNSLITAGSPLRGSVRIFEMLERGWGDASVVVGGVEDFRRIMLSFPSIFDLMPSYEGCCEGDFLATQAFDVAREDAWTKLNWDGVDPASLPDLVEVKRRRTALVDLAETPLPAGIGEALVVGVDQHTTSSYRLTSGEGPARLDYETSWNGDGTVMTDSALLPDRITFRTSFASHGTILNEASVQDFILTALKKGAEQAVMEVPERERSGILTALGHAVELVGVDLVTDQPLYRAGTRARAIVHIRLGDVVPLDPARFDLRLIRPDGTVVPLPLSPDPAQAAPNRPEEQAFSTGFETGDQTGELKLTLSLEDTNGTPRVVTQSVPVVAR
ncbi:esterase/lipase family protein [Roseibium sp. Sym1]|uniref:esterase/lipase family protein n=1 Tax=Roseibium sp. Sym1 TaxID=3016006 RepID=UPI0022B2E648|nr:hypothetical protein [Roseibium sp. Sym1]